LPYLPRGARLPTTRPIHRGWAWVIGFSIVALLTSCATSDGRAPSLLDPHGPAADRIAALIWTLFAVGGTVCLLVLLFLIWALVKRHGPETRPFNENRIIIIAGVVIPTIILFAVFGYSLVVTSANSTPASASRLTVNVVAHQWWWEVQYPDQGFTTANELHIPVGQSVLVKVTAGDVIHDFWVPQLNDKIDVFPGHTNTTWLQASQPGSYTGVCAEYCGVEHAHMNFLVVADPPAQFETWLTAQAQPAAQPVNESDTALKGYQVFIGSSCSYCHAIKGTNAAGNYAPDLTHLASRQNIAAGTLTNNRGNLGGWIANTQGIKPGNRMPAYPLDAQDMQYLLDYLETLK